MDSGKKSYNSSKSSLGKYKGDKLKDKSSTSRQTLFEPNFEPMVFPLIEQTELDSVLPRYSAVLSRKADDGVSMQDLDEFQYDLEKLLSTCFLRHRKLKEELTLIDGGDDRKEKRGKPYDKPLVKRKRIDEKPKYKDARNVAKILKTKPFVPANNFVSDVSVRSEIPKVIIPRHDVTDRFWLSVDPYCQEVSKDNVCFLDELIQECSQEINIKIPEIGEHYALEWADHSIQTEQNNGNMKTLKKQSNSGTYNNDMKKNGINNSMIDAYPSPLTQRLMDALIEVKVIKQMPTAFEKLKSSDYSIKSNNGMRSGLCLDRRLRNELVAQGILDVDDLSKTFPPEDKILLEIKKCQRELSLCNKHNITELNKLRTVVARELRKQEVKAALEVVDSQVLSMYNKILVAKQKHAADLAESSFENLPPKPDLTEFTQEATNIIKQQVLLHRELMDLTDFTLIGNE